MEALGKIGECAGDAAVPHLVQALQDQDNRVIALAVEALGQMGESADEAMLQDLGKSLDHDSIRRCAAMPPKLWAASVMPRPPHARPIAIAAETKTAQSAARPSSPSAEIGPHQRNPVNRCRNAGLRTARTSCRGPIHRGGGGERGDSRLPAALLEDANDQVKIEAMRVRCPSSPAAVRLIEGLCKLLLEDDSVEVQAQAAMALAKLGPNAAGEGGCIGPRRADRRCERTRTGHEGDRDHPASGGDAGTLDRLERRRRRHPSSGFRGLDEGAHDSFSGPSPPLSRRYATLPFGSGQTPRTHFPASTPFLSTQFPFSSNARPTMTRECG